MSIYEACFLQPFPTLYLDYGPYLSARITNFATSGGTVNTISIVIYHTVVRAAHTSKSVLLLEIRAFGLGFHDRGSITLTFTALLAGITSPTSSCKSSAGVKRRILAPPVDDCWLAFGVKVFELAVRSLATTEKQILRGSDTSNTDKGEEESGWACKGKEEERLCERGYITKNKRSRTQQVIVMQSRGYMRDEFDTTIPHFYF